MRSNDNKKLTKDKHRRGLPFTTKKYYTNCELCALLVGFCGEGVERETVLYARASLTRVKPCASSPLSLHSCFHSDLIRKAFIQSLFSVSSVVQSVPNLCDTTFYSSKLL